MPRFIKITCCSSQIDRWINVNKIIEIQRKSQDEDRSFIMMEGGSHTEILYTEESVEQIMEMINGE